MHIIKERKLDEKEAMDIFLRIVDIVERLHEVKVVHRDLKLGNVVLNRKTGNVVLNNFCLAKHLMTKVRKIAMDEKDMVQFLPRCPLG